MRATVGMAVGALLLTAGCNGNSAPPAAPSELAASASVTQIDTETLPPLPAAASLAASLATPVDTPVLPPAQAEQPLTPAENGYSVPRVVTPSPTHSCPTGQAPSAEITSSQITPDPLPNEQPNSMSHQYKVTASGTVTNGTTAEIRFGNPAVTVTVSDQGGSLYLDGSLYELGPGLTAQWSGSRDYLYYDDPSRYPPRLSASVDGWSWANYQDRGCPTR